MDLGTNTSINEFNNKFYQPATPWPLLKAKFLPLPDTYSLDLGRARAEIEQLTKEFELRPFQVGSKFGKKRDRLTYRGLGLSTRPSAKDPLYDSLNLYGTGGTQLDIYNTFAKVSEKKPVEEREIEILDESDFSELTPACTPYFASILKKFKSPFTKVRLLQLLPGGIIPPHVDFPYYEAIRVHSVIHTNDEVFWEVEGEQFQIPADGRFYWFDTGKYHAVVNKGKTPRLVLSVNLLVYKNRDGSRRYSPSDNLEDLILGAQI